jgi:hypothetical protein
MMDRQKKQTMKQPLWSNKQNVGRIDLNFLKAAAASLP